MTRGEEIAAGLSREERAWLLHWLPPVGGATGEREDPVGYPDSPAAERRVKEGLAYAGLVRITREVLTVDGETDEYESFGLTDLGREVAAALSKEKEKDDG